MDELHFLAGLPRSGGTWLKNILDQSPDLAMAGEMHLINPMTARYNFVDWYFAITFIY